MATRKQMPEVNAGSMADIAFLLLIFFLVTTTIESDVGLSGKLPKDNNTATVLERNVLRVSLNASNEVLVEDSLVPLKDLREIAIAFLDNGGLVGGKGKCEYCQGARDGASSDHPQKAVISISTTRATKYGLFIAVQNELAAAYNVLRNREGLSRYNASYVDLIHLYESTATHMEEKALLRSKIEHLRTLFPKLISETNVN